MSAGVPTAPASFDVVVAVASLGGPAALGQLVAGLPADFPAAVLLVQHRAPTSGDHLATLLRRRAQLPVREAIDGQEARRPGVSVLPARHTATVDAAGVLHLAPRGSFRIADTLIASLAAVYGPRVLCVVLTGMLDDGAAGVRAVRRHGGRSIVQDPATAQAASMPAAALATGCVDLVMPLPHIAAALIALTMAPGAVELFRVPPSPWADTAA